MVSIIIFGILALLVMVFVIILLVISGVLLVKAIRHTDIATVAVRTKKVAIVTVIAIVLCTGFAFFTQFTAYTPPIRDASGIVVPGSIAELEQVELNGRKEWISIRGYDQGKPILLFLAGGPGGTHMPFVRQYMPYLEESFVVVNWDQPGSGKSFFAVRNAELTPEMYIEDGIALTKYLCERFGQEKIYLLGESWGSALGIFMAERYPEGYHALFCTGQMVAFLETEMIDYNLAMQLAREEGNTDLVRKLEQNGPPPYYGSEVAWKSADYLGYLDEQMRNNPEIGRMGGNKLLTDIQSSEYGIVDKFTYFLGVLTSFTHVYPQLYDTDLRIDYTVLEVPVYLMLGRHDINAPLMLAEEYFEILDAPYKELIWFEHSGHAPWAYERELFAETLIDISERIAGGNY